MRFPHSRARSTAENLVGARFELPFAGALMPSFGVKSGMEFPRFRKEFEALSYRVPPERKSGLADKFADSRKQSRTHGIVQRQRFVIRVGNQFSQPFAEQFRQLVGKQLTCLWNELQRHQRIEASDML